MEFLIAEIVAISALILNIIVYFSRVPTRKDLNDLRNELRNEIGNVRNKIIELRVELRNEIGNVRSEIRDLRSEMNVRMTKLEEAFTNHLMFMHGTSRQPPTQGEDK